MFGFFIFNPDEPSEKTTILNIQQLDESLKVNIEHRHFQTISVKKNTETYLRFLVDISTNNTGYRDFTVSKDADTTTSVELDKLPAGALLSTRLLILDDSGTDAGTGAQLAVIVKLGNTAKTTWSVKDPKFILTGLNIGFDDSIVNFSPTVNISVDPTVMTAAQYNAWLKTFEPSPSSPITIGFIASDTTNLETAQPFLEQIVAPDLTDYVHGLGYDWDVQFIIEDANGQANTHLEKIQGLHSMGVNLVIGGGWSSQAQSALSYVNSHNMLLVSTSSTSPTLCIANDRLFRMCPADSALTPALVDMMWDYGIKRVIIFQRGDSWGDGIVNLFQPAWAAKGGILAGDTIRYAAEATEFANYLNVANQQAISAVAAEGGDKERVGILLLSFDEFSVIASQAKDYAPFYDCPFFGGDATAISQRGMDDAPQQVNHMRVFSLMAQQPDSVAFNNMKVRYEALTKQQFSFYTANIYDAAWAIVQSVIATGSTDASVVAAAFPGVCNSNVGVSGPLALNEYGDRLPAPFNIWFYAPGNGVASASYVGGVCNSVSGVTTWDETVLMDKLGYVPAGP